MDSTASTRMTIATPLTCLRWSKRLQAHCEMGHPVGLTTIVLHQTLLILERELSLTRSKHVHSWHAYTIHIFLSETLIEEPNI
jgi:hypothetical protein